MEASVYAIPKTKIAKVRAVEGEDMKILVPMNNDQMKEGICPSFGRAPYFMIWDTDSSSAEFVANEATESPSGAGIKAAQIVVDLAPGVVLAPRMGKNAADVINASGITIYKTKSEDAKQNVDFHLEGKLDELTDIHPGFHQHG